MIYGTVEPRNNRPAFKGSSSIKVNILWSQIIVFNVISPLFKGEPKMGLIRQGPAAVQKVHNFMDFFVKEKMNRQ